MVECQTPKTSVLGSPLDPQVPMGTQAGCVCSSFLVGQLELGLVSVLSTFKKLKVEDFVVSIPSQVGKEIGFEKYLLSN